MQAPFVQTGPRAPMHREGDWICANRRCAFYNFARNAVCRKCGLARHGQERPLGSTQASQQVASSTISKSPNSPKMTRRPAAGNSVVPQNDGPIRPSFEDDLPPRMFFPTRKVPAGGVHGGATRYWTYEVYEDAAGRPVQVTYCHKLDQSEACAAGFLDEPMIGFDMEWKSMYQPGIKSNISLIQIAAESRIALFHIARHQGETVAELLAPSLRKIIECPHITKTGVAIRNADGKRLQQYFKVEPRGLFELSHLHKLVTHGATDVAKVNKRLVALSTLNLEHLGLPLHKGSVRCADWAKAELDDEEIRYAATDAYSGYQLFRAMNEKRLAMRPAPPLPAFAELNLPIATKPILEEVDEHIDGFASDSSPDSDRELELTQVGSQVLDALVDWRSQASQDSGYPDEALADDAVLYQIARSRPRTMDALQQIAGPHQADQGLGRQYLRIVRETKERGAYVTSHSSLASLSTSEASLADNTADNSVVVEEAEEAITQDVEPTLDLADALTVEASIITASREPEVLPEPSSQTFVGTSQSTVRADNDDDAAAGVDHRLLSALSGLRIQLAGKIKVEPDKIATRRVLRDLASARSAHAKDLQSVRGAPAFAAIANTCGISVVDWIARYRTPVDDAGLELLSGELSRATIFDDF